MELEIKTNMYHIKVMTEQNEFPMSLTNGNLKAIDDAVIPPYKLEEQLKKDPAVVMASVDWNLPF